MKYIKSYKIFESTYSIDEYILSISSELGKYNITPVAIRTLLDNYSDIIQNSMENEVTPHNFVKNIIKDMDLSSGGFISQMSPPSQPTEIKYL